MDASLLLDTVRVMTVILGGLVAGYGMRRAGWASAEFGTGVNRATLAYASPFVVCLALWSIEAPDLRTLALPLLGAVLMAITWPVSHLLGGLLGPDRAEHGSFVTMSVFSNLGFTYGAFLTFIALGTQGAALGSLYCACFVPTFFSLGFIMAQRYSPGARQSILGAMLNLTRHGYTRNPVLAIAAGITLSALGISPPSWASGVIDALAPTTTAAFLFAIGLGLRLSAVKTYWRHCLLIHPIRFLISPVIGLGLAYLLGYWDMSDHSLLKVVFIQAATPSAIIAVMLSDLFRLNRDLAGALWLATNVTGVFLAPVILLIARAL